MEIDEPQWTREARRTSTTMLRVALVLLVAGALAGVGIGAMWWFHDGGDGPVPLLMGGAEIVVCLALARIVRGELRRRVSQAVAGHDPASAGDRAA